VVVIIEVVNVSVPMVRTEVELTVDNIKFVVQDVMDVFCVVQVE